MTDDQMTQLLDKASAALRFGDKAGNFMAKSKPQFDTAAVNATPLSVAETSPSTAATFVPTFAALDKVVLRFDAYIKETFPDGNRGQLPGASHAEQEFAIRHVMIKYFVEDDSIAVVEPPVENSGLAQGVLMKRQLLPKPAEDMVGMQNWGCVCAMRCFVCLQEYHILRTVSSMLINHRLLDRILYHPGLCPGQGHDLLWQNLSHRGM